MAILSHIVWVGSLLTAFGAATWAYRRGVRWTWLLTIALVGLVGWIAVETTYDIRPPWRSPSVAWGTSVEAPLAVRGVAWALDGVFKGFMLMAVMAGLTRRGA